MTRDCVTCVFCWMRGPCRGCISHGRWTPDEGVLLVMDERKEMKETRNCRNCAFRRYRGCRMPCRTLDSERGCAPGS